MDNSQFKINNFIRYYSLREYEYTENPKML